MKIFGLVVAITGFGLCASGSPTNTFDSSDTLSNAISARASFPIPASKGSVTYSSAQKITSTFDGGLKTYGRGVKCTGQVEGDDSDAVFILADGATLKNAIIGADQIEGVHCQGSCTISNVWWTAVCEDALSLKGDGNALVTGGGARGAEDKVVQHNGMGKVTIQDFTASDFGKLYRSCGNCKNMGRRDVVVRNVKATNGKVLVGINSNYGDVATIEGGQSCVSNVKDVCVEYEGTSPGHEPKKIGSGQSAHCKYSTLKTC